MSSAWEETLAKMLLSAPDPNEPLPRSNRKETIWGSTISLLIITWLAVGFRLWTRLKVLREPGWDDLFVVLSALCNTAGTIGVCLAVNYGLGKHMLYTPLEDTKTYLLLFYISHSFYLTESALIKISLLLQYLRIFTAGRMRKLCIALLWLIAVWGLVFSFMGWVPCFPVRGAWEPDAGAKCYGFGFADEDSFVNMFTAHASTNMVLDIAIFATPLVLFRTPNLKSRSLLAMVGIFTCGSLVIFISAWRLFLIVKHRAGLFPYPDFTWWVPGSFILACVEIDLAIICTSVPIFWPAISNQLAAIFVSFEVKITEQHMNDEYGPTYRLEDVKSNEPASPRSSSAASTNDLMNEHEGVNARGPLQNYSVGIDPLGPEAQSGNGLETHIKSLPKPKWEL